MKKFLGGKKWTAVGIAFVLLVLVGLIVLAVRYYLRVDMTYSQTTFIEGVYSVDGGEWKPIDNMHPINERFHKVTLKGKLSENALKLFENTTIFSQNVWYTTKSADGKPVYELTYRNMDDLYNLYVQASDNPDDPMLDKEVFKDNYHFLCLTKFICLIRPVTEPISFIRQRFSFLTLTNIRSTSSR